MSDAGQGFAVQYARLCKSLGKTGRNTKKADARKRRIRELEAKISGLENRQRSLHLSGSAAGSKKLLGQIDSRRHELAVLSRIDKQSDFKRAMRITGLGLEVEEVIRFAATVAIISMIAALALSVAAGIWLGLDFLMLSVLVAGCSIVVPLSMFMFILTYPERLARSMELEAFGSAPEIINYMVMSMELAPSIDRALLFAADNAEGPMANELRTLVWKVRTREYATTEEALAAYALELEGLNEELRSAIYNILSASKESSGETRRSSLRRASELVLTGTRQRVEEFAASLATPATVLFGLGILLPMIIGSLLPMMSFGGFDAGLGTGPSQQGGWLMAFFISILLMDMIFPAAAFLYARSILSRRPGIHTISPDTGSIELRKRAAGAAGIMALFMILAWAVGTHVPFWGMENAASALTALSGIGLALGYALGPGNRTDNSFKNLERLEDQMPDMLFQLGSRLTEGLAIESALEETSVSMRDTEMGRFLEELITRFQRSGLGLDELLFGDAGILANHRSRKLRATMKLVVEASSKNPELAGRMLMSMSNHMRELAKTDRDMRVKLRSTIDSMRHTALFFAPVIMGVTVGLYRLLSRTFGEMQGSQSMPVFHFIMIMGTYLLMTVAIIISFCSGIENGKGKWQRDVALALPVSAIIFSITSLGALLAFG